MAPSARGRPRRTASVRAHRLGLAAPYNEALTALLKGREQDTIHRRENPDLDYGAREAEAEAEEEKRAGA